MYYYKEARTPNRLLGKALLALSRYYLRYKIDLKVEANDTKKLEPPYLILGNHVTYWDPFLVNMFIDEPMCYIAASVYFRNPIFRFVLNYAGSIPKKKFMTHYSPIKRLIRAKESGRILGIFPEGERKWDGTTDEMTFRSTAKLIKKLNVPVVTVKIKGGYLAYPRWAKFSRRGKVSLTYRLSLTPDEIQRFSVERIEDRMRQSLTHDEVAYQKKVANYYSGKNLAEHLEYLLFACPHCQSYNTLISKGNELYCHQCRYRVTYNQFGFLERLDGKLYFDNLRDWNRWQNGYMKKFIVKKMRSNDSQCILEDYPVAMLKGAFDQPFNPEGQGKLCLEEKGLYFYLSNEEKFEFKFKQMTGLNVQFHAVLEFTYKKGIYHFKFHNKHISAYKWVQAICYTKEEMMRMSSLKLEIAG